MTATTGAVTATVPATVRSSGGPYATCPLCHTVDAVLTEAAVAAGAGWTCAICSANWDATALRKVAAYRAWVVEHDAVMKRAS